MVTTNAISRRIFGINRVPVRRSLAVFLILALTACGGANRDDPTFGDNPRDASRGEYADPNRETVFGPGGILGSFGRPKEDGGGGGIGINSFLWRASLDTLSFMPLTSADPFGGVIITDWYSPPETPRERFKLNIYILDRRLRADGIKVALFRQERVGANEWRDAVVNNATATQLENAILRRARELRLATLEE
jgi:hypothetical protein